MSSLDSFAFVEDDALFDQCVDEVLGQQETRDLNEIKLNDLFLFEESLSTMLPVNNNTLAASPPPMTSAPQQPQQVLEKPKRSLSAYNLFFQSERKNLLKSLPPRQGKKKPRNSHGKMGFAEMARCVSAKWKKLTPEEKKPFQELAAMDTKRYQSEMTLWKQSQSNLEQARIVSMQSMNGVHSQPQQGYFAAPAQQISNDAWMGFTGTQQVPVVHNVVENDNMFLHML
mmetsp:Transcript_19307/g.41532  ORF Transcript_19307/g.41532 Transcript_19307/m.41532 type:complete len:228 (+) Transcript_19307:126-809(+)